MILTVDKNIIKSAYGPDINMPAILIDNMGVLHKYGNVEMVRQSFVIMANKLPDFGFQVIEFNQYSNLSIDDICSIMNYSLNAHCEELYHMLNTSDPKELRDWIDKIQIYGY